MAKLKMKRIELIAPLTDSKQIIELLQRRGVVELCENSSEELEQMNVAAVMGEFEKFRSTVDQALNILDKYAPEKASLTDVFGGRDEIEKHEFGRKAADLEKIMNAAGEIIKNHKTITEAQAEIIQLGIRSDLLEPWTTLDVPTNFKGTSKTNAYIGSIQGSRTAEEIEAQLPEGCCVEVVSNFKEQTNLFILCSKDVSEEAENCLRRLAFVPVSESASITPSEMIRKNTAQRKELNKLIAASEKAITEKSEYREMLKFGIDFLSMRREKYEVLGKLGVTESTFVLEGYVPEKYFDSLKREIEKKHTAVISGFEPAEDEDVPVLLENSSFSSPVEGITKMYAMPSKTDVDPTPVMSFFYYLFFGMMLSDAGYGIVMVIGTMIALKKFKLENSMRKTLIMFRNCGISTIFWGAMFGSWFGDIVQIVGREFFGKEIGSIALWFQPLDDPIKLLLYSFGLGILHLFLGVGVSFKMAWDDGRKLDAFLEIGRAHV